MDIVYFDTHVTISPREMGCHLRDLMYKKLIDMYVGKCLKRYGYIIEILHFTYDREYILSRVNQYVYVKCQLEVLSITPKVGQYYYGIVKTVYPRGMFVSMINIFDTLIPLDLLEKSGYVYVPSLATFENAETRRRIIVGEIVNVELTNVHYDSKTFNCIAKLVDL
jgi:DNA-directed RNA polymerase subunit E'/Rpb7